MVSIKKKPMGYHYDFYINGKHHDTYWDGINDSQMMGTIARYFISNDRSYYNGSDEMKLRIVRYPYDVPNKFNEPDKYFIMHVKSMTWDIGSAKWWSVSKSGKKGAVHNVDITKDNVMTKADYHIRYMPRYTRGNEFLTNPDGSGATFKTLEDARKKCIKLINDHIAICCEIRRGGVEKLVVITNFGKFVYVNKDTGTCYMLNKDGSLGKQVDYHAIWPSLVKS